MEIEKTHKARDVVVGKTHRPKPRKEGLSETAKRLREIREIRGMLNEAARQLTCCQRKTSNDLVNEAYERILPLVTRFIE